MAARCVHLASASACNCPRIGVVAFVLAAAAVRPYAARSESAANGAVVACYHSHPTCRHRAAAVAAIAVAAAFAAAAIAFAAIAAAAIAAAVLSHRRRRVAAVTAMDARHAIAAAGLCRLASPTVATATCRTLAAAVGPSSPAALSPPLLPAVP